LLTWLDSEDREAAGIKYEKIRLKLVKLFKWRNCQPEEDYADETINRVTRRIAEGAPVEVREPYLYFHGIALNVVREFWRSQQKHKQEDFDSLAPAEFSAESAERKMEREFEQAQAENRYRCMNQCLRELPDETREFIVEYHHGERKKDARKLLSERLKIPLNALRIRACRIRADLEKCVEKCVKKIS
jgi:DNA-directed RNA polymerase specialized sigma24 family protein